MEIKSSLILKKYEGFFFSIPFTQRFSIMFDAGQSAAYMQLAAWELGIGSVPATIYKRGKAREILAYLEEKECNIALSFGYPEKEDALTRPPQKGGGAVPF
ncbi:MAG: nitroreductase family protein [Anaerolineales bacterium]|nr:nitroreductase family protein [Anaerolineales bacterium]